MNETDMYMLTEPKAGWREVLVKDNHKAVTYAEVIQHLAEEVYADAHKITLIEDNHAAHKLSALYEILPPKRARAIIERIEVVRTPKHGSWLNIAEIELSILTRQGLAKRVESKEALKEQATQWYQQRNKQASKVEWQFTTKEARIKLKRLYPKMQH
ncbi:transposase [Microscilla marina]|uniref:Transposase for insertion sequence element n=1 Tax=Microscilla marina ATCC 23134 TaxID=313606 RepID=A1ZF16_MICM2|nr:transposase [Microscilla marina]EAY31118.1 transposase for insertion sequence element [Microscilla marina ATCC 23134]